MADASIILSAKNGASAVLQQVGKDMKSMADSGDQSAKIVGNASNAMKQALAGDFVGAAKSAMGAWKTLCAALASNPVTAVAVAIGALVTGLLKGLSAWKEWTGEVKAATKANDEFLASLDRSRNGTLTPQEQVQADAAKYVEAGDRKTIERRLAILRQNADAEEQQARDTQAALLKAQTTWTPGIWEGMKGMVGAETREGEVKKLTTARDEAKAALDATMAQIKTLEGALAKIDANEQAAAKKKAEEEAADAEKKRKEDEERAEKKRKEDEEETERKQKEIDDLRKEYEDLAEDKAAMEKKAADDAKKAWIKAMQEAAAQQVKDAEAAANAALAAWNISGADSASKQARRDQRQAERQAEKDARQQAQALARWENGARDRRATAAHDLDEARKAMDAAKASVAAAQQAADAYQKEQDAERLRLMQSMDSRMDEIKTKLFEALYPA